MSTQKVQGIVLELQRAVDELGSNFNKVKDLILDLARVLDETGECERGHISRKIKELLLDKIKEGKISVKGIHECSPAEYKRQYNKRELNSLSNEEEDEKAIVSLQTEGTALVQKVSDNNAEEEYVEGTRGFRSSNHDLNSDSETLADDNNATASEG
jgi:hypothetical protein